MTNETTRPATETVGKLSMLSLGVPQGALADENVNKATMGRIFGRATGIVRRTKKNEQEGTEEKLRGLRGSFIAIPADEKRAQKKSSVLYLPEGLGGGMLDRFEMAEKDGELITIDIALEGFVERAKNPSGYSWGARSLLPEGTDGVTEDPAMEVMRLAGAAPAAPAIADQSGDADPILPVDNDPEPATKASKKS